MRVGRVRGAAVAAAAVVLLAACTSTSAQGQRHGHQTLPPTTPTGPVAVQGPQPPATGAWIGAWVKPDVATQAGRISAVEDFERAIGQPIQVVHVYHQWADVFPTESDTAFAHQGKVLMISWAGTDSAAVASGQDDALIRQRADALKALGTPVLLRWRWEMNRKNLAATVGTPAQYVAAWDHVRALFAAEGATNVGWVWCPLASSFTETNAPAYYPGDNQVDWLCSDVYAIGTNKTFAEVAQDFMTWAAGHHKPVMIGEYGSDLADPSAKQAWIAGATAYAKAHEQIKAMVYFDAMRTASNGQLRDFRVQAAAGPLAAFRAMADDPWFRQPTGLA
jgi:hypothetical protein